MNAFIVSIGLMILASVIQGSWSLAIKKSAPYSWEAFWALFSVLGMILLPYLWARMVIPDVMTFLLDSSKESILVPFIFGMLWGIGAIAFGLAIVKIGMSLTYGINMGIGAAVGALVPFFLLPDIPPGTMLLVTSATVIIILGIVVNTRAGLNRERIQEQDKGLRSGNMKSGLILAVIAGLSTAAFNIGFNSCMPLIHRIEKSGISIQNASMVAWLLVLSGGFLANFLYAMFLLLKNNTYRDYVKSGSMRSMLATILAAAGFFAAIALYGQAAAMMGNMGPVVGWILFNSIALIVSNLWGIRTGEWTGAEKELRRLFLGNSILIIAWILLAISNVL